MAVFEPFDSNNYDDFAFIQTFCHFHLVFLEEAEKDLALGHLAPIQDKDITLVLFIKDGFPRDNQDALFHPDGYLDLHEHPRLQAEGIVEGEVATRFIESDREVDIRVRLSEGFRDRVDKISRINIRNGLGMMVPLKALAEIQIKEGPAEIRRILQQKSAVITGNISGTSLDIAKEKVMAAAAAIDCGPECSIYLAGQSMEQDVAFSSMIFAIFLAIFLVYLVMASQFESFIKPFIIMFTIPLGIIGVVIVGLVFSMSINVIVLIGLIILSGIIVNNAIVLVDYIGKLEKQGMSKTEAIKTAAQVRWRPIIMTSITTVLALVPMALAFSEGFEIRIPLALTLIGGLIFGTFLTLIFIPLVYSMVVRDTKVTEEKQSRSLGFPKSLKMTPSLDKAKAKKP